MHTQSFNEALLEIAAMDEKHTAAARNYGAFFSPPGMDHRGAQAVGGVGSRNANANMNAALNQQRVVGNSGARIGAAAAGGVSAGVTGAGISHPGFHGGTAFGSFDHAVKTLNPAELHMLNSLSVPELQLLINTFKAENTAADILAAAAASATAAATQSNRGNVAPAVGPPLGVSVSARDMSRESAHREGDIDPPAAPKNLQCTNCGAGPFNSKGLAMHNSRWCKEGQSGGPSSRGGGSFPSTRPTDAGELTGGSGVKRDSAGTATGDAAKRSRVAEVEQNDGLTVQGIGVGGATGGGYASLLGGAMGGIGRDFPLGAKGGLGNGAGLLNLMASGMNGLGAFGMMHDASLMNLLAGAGARHPTTPNDEAVAAFAAAAAAAVAASSTLKLDIVVFKEDGAFVAKAPLTVSSSITLGELREAIFTNTNGALPPHRQQLRYLGQVLHAPDNAPLLSLVSSAESITLTLSIIAAEPS